MTVHNDSPARAGAPERGWDPIDEYEYFSDYWGVELEELLEEGDC